MCKHTLTGTVPNRLSLQMTKKEQQFVSLVWKYYEAHGRHHLPWRLKKYQTPYAIAVSEVMLQQTQVDRVVPKYVEFMKRWPHTRALAQAPLREVLIVWQGLGYNSRAKRLVECARVVRDIYKGRWPKDYTTLLTLPGIGPYTAGAITAFAYDEEAVLLETNIRTVYIHHFFSNVPSVSDKEIEGKVRNTLPAENFRAWYAALMDYGTYLKKEYGNNITRSSSYRRQSIFKGSDREVRGAVIDALRSAPRTRKSLQKLPFEMERIVAQLQRLEGEGMVEKHNRTYHLPT